MDYYTRTGKPYPAKLRQILEAIAGYPHPGPTSTDLQAQLGLTRQQAAAWVSVLVRQGRIRRVRRNYWSRAYSMELTRVGERRLEWLRAQAPTGWQSRGYA